MSKQSQANVIYTQGQEMSLSRGVIIEQIILQTKVSNAYASTLYNNARKAALPTQSAPATTHTKPKSGEITKFTQQTCRAVDKAIEDALKQVEQQFGISINVGGGSLSDHEFTTKLTVRTGDGSDAARKQFELYAFRFGLNDSDFGKTFTAQGEQYQVTGIKPRSRKYPVIAKNVRTGVDYKFPASMIK